MNVPKELKYTKSHEWIQEIGENLVRIGLTDYAQDSLGGLVFVNLPEEGAAVTAGESLGDVESVKAVSDIYSPVTGNIKAVNAALLDAPERINEDPYGAWLAEISDVSAAEVLLTAQQYEAFCSEGA